jgi:serine/threonine protein kinase
VPKGLQYMHQHGLVHGDFHGVNHLSTSGLKLTHPCSQANILVHEGHALLTDFGLTVVGDESQSEIPTNERPAAGHGAIRWLAPKLLTEENQTPRKTMAGDMFVFGRLCLAVCRFISLYCHSLMHAFRYAQKENCSHIFEMS